MTRQVRASALVRAAAGVWRRIDTTFSNAASTTGVAALVRVSLFMAPSVKLTRTLSVWPMSAATGM